MNDLHAMSSRQKNYLQSLKRNSFLIQLSRILLLFFLVGLWEVSARMGWIDSFIFSSPSQIWEKMMEMLRDQTLLRHVSITLAETLISFFLVTLLGIGAALVLWAFPRLSQVLEPYLVVLNSLPKSALAPLLIVWLGSNMRTIVIAGISVAIFGAVLNLYTGFCETDPDKLKLIRTLGGGKKEELAKVILPASVPLILSVMKVNIGLSLIGIVIGEMIGSKNGLGYLIIYSSQVFQLTTMIMSIVILCLIAILLYGAITLLQRHCLKGRQ
ncbi:MAG: ABC transporter permease [Blautia sp.]